MAINGRWQLNQHVKYLPLDFTFGILYTFLAFKKVKFVRNGKKSQNGHKWLNGHIWLNGKIAMNCNEYSRWH